MKRLAPIVATLLLLVGLGLWVVTHVSPDTVGDCHRIAVFIGPKPTVKDCEPLGAGDFGVIFGLGAMLVLLLSGEPLTTPFGTLRRRSIKDAAQVLDSEGSPAALDQIAAEAFKDLRP
jgi:hypothetical protein